MTASTATAPSATHWPGQFFELVKLNLLILREAIWFILLVQAAFIVGFVLGFGYLIPNIDQQTALYLTTGAATQSIVTVGLVFLPQFLAQAKDEGRLDYFFTLPISREVYLLAQLTVVVLLAAPGIVMALVAGAWRYDLTLDVDPGVAAVVPLAVFSLAGFGVAVAMISPHLQITNAFTQLIIFYVIFFAPVMIPESQLPTLLQYTADVLPPGYAADGMRATVTDLPGTHLMRSLGAMAVFSTISITVAAAVVRRRR